MFPDGVAGQESESCPRSIKGLGDKCQLIADTEKCHEIADSSALLDHERYEKR